MTTQGNTTDDLFTRAHQRGRMSDASLQVAQRFHNPGANLQRKLGRPAGIIHAAKGTLTAEVVDDSSSIGEFDNAQVLMDGRNEVIEALRGANSLQRDGLSILTIRMNAGPLDPQNLFLGVMDVPLLDATNYHSYGVTPLYQRTVEAALLLIAAAEAQLKKGVKSSILLHIITDGEDVPLATSMGGKYTTPAEVAQVLSDLRRREDSLIRATGIPGNNRIDFHQIFAQMGLMPDEITDLQNRTTLGSKADRQKAIRAHFQQFSSAAVGFTNAAYGQSKQGFLTGSQQAGGGFLNP